MPSRDLRTKPAVVISGTTAGLAVVRSLGARGVRVIVANYADDGSADVSRFAHGSVRLPDPERDEAGFVDALLGRADELRGALLVPGSDEALVAVARSKERLEEVFAVGSPGWDVVKRVIEKRLTYEIAQSVGVPIPRTAYPTSLDDVEHFASVTDYPCLVKPSQSHLFVSRFGRKMFPAADAHQLGQLYLRAVDAGLEVVLQEFVPGRESDGANYISYRCDGQPVVEFTARKVRNAPPRYGSPRVVMSSSISELSEPAHRLLEALGLDGFSCTEFKRDERDGTYKLMEVNARHNLSGMLAVHCGVDFPWLHYQHVMYGERPTQPDYAERVYWIDVPRDVAYTLRNIGREGTSARDLVRPYVGPHVFAVASARDPRPLLRRVFSGMRVAWRRILPRA